MRTNYKDFKKGIQTIFPEKDKEIIGAVISVAYDDGTFNRAAILPDSDDDFNINLASDILSRATSAILQCQCELPVALKKVAGLVA